MVTIKRVCHEYTKSEYEDLVINYFDCIASGVRNIIMETITQYASMQSDYPIRYVA